ncbi:MAG: S8 family serine peptidase [Oscillospiraceae bacterium]
MTRAPVGTFLLRLAALLLAGSLLFFGLPVAAADDDASVPQTPAAESVSQEAQDDPGEAEDTSDEASAPEDGEAASGSGTPADETTPQSGTEDSGDGVSSTGDGSSTEAEEAGSSDTEGVLPPESEPEAAASTADTAPEEPTPEAGTEAETDAPVTDDEDETEDVDASTQEKPKTKDKTKAEPVDDPDAGVLYVPGELLVLFEDGVSPQEAEATLALSDPDAEISIKEELGDGSLLLNVGADATVLQAVDALNGQPGVRVAQPNYLYALPETAQAGEPAATAQEDLQAPSATSVNDKYAVGQWYLDAVKARNAWDVQKVSGTVRVGVIDSGVVTSHPDLKNNLDMAYALNAVTGGKLTTDVEYFGHGTHVAGIIAAQANNGIGIAGVSYNAKIVPVNVFFEYNGGVAASTNSVVKAINHLMQVPALKVINMSLGGSTYDKLLHDAMKRATDAGITCVASAGNENTSAQVYPSDFDEIISVTALAQSGSRAEYSNYNKYKNIAAPGSTIYSTGKQSAYMYMSGTSMAAPIVSAVAALLYAQNPKLTPAGVKEILYNTADDLGTPGRDNYYGHGRVNAYRALRYSLDTSVTSVALDATTRVMNPGYSFTLTPSFTPSFADNTSVSWATSNAAVAVVNNGVVRAVAPGTADITVTTADGGHRAVCTVTCIPATTADVGSGDKASSGSQTESVQLTGIVLNHTVKTVKPKGSLSLKATWAASGKAADGVKWKTSKKSVATVSKTGKVKAKAAGKAKITATVGGHKASCTITVGTPVSKVKVSGSKARKLAQGGKVTLKASVSPAAATNKKVLWTSADTRVATVSKKGAVKAVGMGKTVITAASQDGGKKAKVTITVGEKVRSVQLNHSKYTLKKGKKVTLKATITPTNAAIKTVKWKSSKKSVATVSSKGRVVAIAKGKTTITCTTTDGKRRAKCVIQVK